MLHRLCRFRLCRTATLVIFSMLVIYLGLRSLMRGFMRIAFAAVSDAYKYGSMFVNVKP